MARKGDVKDPRTDLPLPPKFLGDSIGALPPDSDRLLALSDWLTSPGNQRFVDTTANRIWYHLVGQGIVDPIDDFRATNPPSNPQLLAALTADLIEHQFSLKHLVRTIMNSKVYQMSAGINQETNWDDILLEAVFPLSRLACGRQTTAVVTTSCISRQGAKECGSRPNSWPTLSRRLPVFPFCFSGYPQGMRAGELPGVAAERDRDRLPAAASRPVF